MTKDIALACPNDARKVIENTLIPRKGSTDPCLHLLHTNRRSLHHAAYLLHKQHQYAAKVQLLAYEDQINTAMRAFNRTLPVYPLWGNDEAFAKHVADNDPDTLQNMKCEEVHVHTGFIVETLLRRVTDPDNCPAETLCQEFRHVTGRPLIRNFADLYAQAIGPSADSSYHVAILHDDKNIRLSGGLGLICDVIDVMITANKKNELAVIGGNEAAAKLILSAYNRYQEMCNSMRDALMPARQDIVHSPTSILPFRRREFA